MKRCPTCNSTYTDDAPGFCPQDGTQLVGGLPAYNPQPQAANVAPTQASNVPPYNQPYNQAYNQPAYFQPQPQTPAMPQRLPHNPMRKWVQISKVTLIVSVALLLLFLVMVISHNTGNPVAILAAVFGGCGLLFGIIGFFSYGKQVDTIDEMLKQAGHPQAMQAGGNLLAHWTYTPQEWSQFIQSETARKRTVNIILIGAMLLVFVITMTAFLSGNKGRGVSFGPLAMFIIILSLIGLFVWWMATAEVRRMKAQTTGEAFIAKNGLLFNDHYYPWGFFGYSLDGVFYEPGNPNTIRFRYLSMKGGSYGPNYESVRVPVPAGREAEAQSVASHFHR